MQTEKVFIRPPRSIPRSLVVEYLNRCSNGLAALKDALDRSDYESARVFGHRLSGTGGAYGVPVLTELGAAMEQKAVERNLGELQTQAAAVEDYLGRIEILPE